MNKVLIVDDEKHIINDLCDYLTRKKTLEAFKANTISEADKIIKIEKIDYAIVDLKMSHSSEFGGIHLINYIKKIQPRVKVIILSAYKYSDVIKAQLEVEIDGYIEKGGEKNYLIAVLEKIDGLEKSTTQKNCFVIMPFSDSKSCTSEEWTEIFNELIKPSIEKSGFNYNCKRSEALAGNIIEDILDELNRADLVIADLTDKNPNVFYELGVRHALRNTTILISQNIDDIPFDLRPYAIQIYNWKTIAKRKEFMDKIKIIIQEFEDNHIKTLSPVRKYLKLIDSDK
jgi:YesN/AraC family two-component response regulator